MSQTGLAGNKDFLFIQEAAENLEDYLLSPVLFYPLSRVEKASQSKITAELTLGKLLLSLKRLEGHELSPLEIKSLNAALGKIQRVHSQWKSNWLAKAENEFTVRLRLWTKWLQDWHGDDLPSLSVYQAQIFQRTILTLLEQEDGFTTTQNILQSLDKRLQLLTVPGAFVWEESLAESFPTEIFWYLYRQPKH